MKHLFLLMAAAVLFTACKKSKEEASQPAFAKNLTELSLSNGAYTKFSYSSSGRVADAVGKFTTTFYQYQPSFMLKHTYLSSGNVYEFKNAVKNAAGRITSVDRFYNGTLQSKLKFSYNAEGYLTNFIWERLDIVSKAECNYFYQDGNLVKLEDYGNGKLEGSFLYEYDLSKQNPFKLDWYEFSQIGFIVDDQFGKMSRNLVKKEIQLDKDGNLYKQSEFNFTLNAEGYPTSMEEIRGLNKTMFTFKFQ
jgi:antitoxin component YwqK of YwqJK toxin-antitoxin module